MTDHPKANVEYSLVRCNRRTISINVDRNGMITVRAPYAAPMVDIRRFVEQKHDWILQAQQRQLKKKALTPAFVADGMMPYLGKQLQLQMGDEKAALLSGDRLLLPKSGSAKGHVLKWLIQQAESYLPERVRYWAQRMGLQPASLTIANPKTRWGSMKNDGSMRLNVALMHCDPALIDYVIVHELSHMVHMNHSPAFHAHTARYLPDAQTRRKALKQLGGYLTYLRES